MLHFLNQLVVYTIWKLAFSKLTKITPLTCSPPLPFYQYNEDMGRSFAYARQHTGLLWHTAVRSSVHASYDNISHLFPLLLIGHVVTYVWDPNSFKIEKIAYGTASSLHFPLHIVGMFFQSPAWYCVFSVYLIYKFGRNVHCPKRPCPKCPWPKRHKPKYPKPKRPLAEMSADHRNIHIWHLYIWNRQYNFMYFCLFCLFSWLIIGVINSDKDVSDNERFGQIYKLNK
jgi:hypothetical protein